MALNEVWDWNPITGDPFIPPADSPNSRYCPTPDEMIFGNMRTTGMYLKSRIFDFMTSNQNRLTTRIDAHNSGELRGFLRVLRALQFKKIHVEYISGGTVTMTKLPSDSPFIGEPDLGVNRHRIGQNNRAYDLAEDINFNSMRGYLGPGTFPCFALRCDLCAHVGGSPTVNLGPHGQLQLTKRAYCFTKNTVYVGVCHQCEEADQFACYFGESSVTLCKRCHHHKGGPCNTTNVLKDRTRFPTTDLKRAEVERVIAAGVDPEDVLRDWFSHVTPGGIHPEGRRMSVVDIIPNKFRRKNRERNLVEQYMFRDDDFDYRGMGIGCLNTYGGD